MSSIGILSVLDNEGLVDFVTRFAVLAGFVRLNESVDCAAAGPPEVRWRFVAGITIVVWFLFATLVSIVFNLNLNMEQYGCR